MNEPMSLPQKALVKRMHEYLQLCFPRVDEGALYEVTIELWKMFRQS